jgi:hypothetical protein
MPLVCGREMEVKGSRAVECFLRHYTEKKICRLWSAVAKVEMKRLEQNLLMSDGKQLPLVIQRYMH